MNKKIIVSVFLAGCLFFSTASASAEGYFSVGGGGGGNAESYNLTMESGVTAWEFGKRKYLFGAGIPLIPHGYENVPSDTLESPCPHSECVSAGTEYDGTELGLFAKAGMEAVYPGVYLSLLAGFTRGTEIEVFRSTATGRNYEQSSEKKNYALYGLSMGYFRTFFDDDWKLCFYLDADNRRGLTASFGFFW